MLGSFLAKVYVDVGFVDLGMGLLHIREEKVQNVIIWHKRLCLGITVEQFYTITKVQTLHVPC